MIVKYSTTLPWWIINQEDKPTMNAFNNWKQQYMVEKDLKLNMVNDYSSLSLISNDNTIKYVGVEINGKHYYYYVIDFKLIANNTYTLDLSIDLWATYFMEAFFSIEPNKEVFIKRCHNLTTDEKELTKIQDDPVLDQIKPVIGNVDSWGEEEFKKVSVGSEEYIFPLDANTKSKGVGSWYSSINSVALYQHPSYADAYIMFPLPQINTDKGANFKTCNYNGLQVNAYNNWKQCYIDINKNQLFMNNFIGVYTVPNWLIMSDFYYATNIDGKNFLGSIIKHKAQNSYASNLRFNINKNMYLNNRTDLLSPKIIDYIPMFFGKDKINSTDFGTIDGTRQNMNNIYFDFNGTFIAYFTNKLSGLESWPKKLPGPLKSTVDRYKEYVAQNQNRINSGIQSSTLGLVQGMGMIGVGAATGNPYTIAGGFQGMVGGGHSILNQTATIMDLKNSLVPKQKESYVLDNMYDLPEGNIKPIKQHLLLFKYDLKNLVEYNNAIVLYGYEFNNLKTFQSSTTPGFNAQHCFISFRIDYYKKMFYKKYQNIPLRFQETYLNLLDKGIRLWSSTEMEFIYV